MAQIAIWNLPAMVSGSIVTVLEQNGHDCIFPPEIVEWMLHSDTDIPVAVGTFVLEDLLKLKEIRGDAVLVAFLASKDTISYASTLLGGAQAILTEEYDPIAIVEAIDLGYRGLAVIPAGALLALATHFPTPIEPPLSDQELAWMVELAHGRTIERLAMDSGFSNRHFNRLIKTTYGKLGTTTKMEALLEARRRGLL